MFKNKKSGFTLAELLIALAIVGVIAVISLSVLNKNMPNRDRMMYMKNYMRISTIVDTLVNDEDAYPNKDDNYSYGDFPFFNTTITENTKTARKLGITGDHSSKLCRLIADKYHVTNQCTDAAIPAELSYGNPSFSTNDGVDFYIYTDKSEVGTLTDGRYSTEYKTVVYIDTFGIKNKDQGNNCMFDRDSCTEPDTHKFIISADGKIYPVDAMSIYYTKNPKDKRNNKQKDYTSAELDKIASYAIADSEVVDLGKGYLRPRGSAAEGGEVEKLEDPGNVAANKGSQIIVSLAKEWKRTVISGGGSGSGSGNENTCTGGQTLVNGVCQCPDGQTWENNACTTSDSGNKTITLVLDKWASSNADYLVTFKNSNAYELKTYTFGNLYDYNAMVNIHAGEHWDNNYEGDLETVAERMTTLRLLVNNSMKQLYTTEGNLVTLNSTSLNTATQKVRNAMVKKNIIMLTSNGVSAIDGGWNTRYTTITVNDSAMDWGKTAAWMQNHTLYDVIYCGREDTGGHKKNYYNYTVSLKQFADNVITEYNKIEGTQYKLTGKSSSSSGSNSGSGGGGGGNTDHSDNYSDNEYNYCNEENAAKKYSNCGGNQGNQEVIKGSQN